MDNFLQNKRFHFQNEDFRLQIGEDHKITMEKVTKFIGMRVFRSVVTKLI